MKRYNSIAGLAIVLALNSAPALADSSDSTTSGSFASGISRFFSSLFGSRSETQKPRTELKQAKVEERSQEIQSQPQEEQAQVEQFQAEQFQAEQPMNLVSVRMEESVAAPRPAITWQKRPNANPIFRAYEKYDANNPESYNRIIDALKEDEEASALVLAVLSETGKSDLREIVEIKPARFSYQSGTTQLKIEGEAPGVVLPGWPGIDANGRLLIDPNPGSRLKVEVKINSSLQMIEVYSSIIHELTHVLAQVRELKTRNHMDVLDYKDATDYAMQKIDGAGGEVDAFIAEISAVIRYRNRYHLPFESFRTPVKEKYFDDRSGKIVDREGLKQNLTSSGGQAGYLGTRSQEFRSFVAWDLGNVEKAYQQLKSDPNFERFPQNVHEEANRLRIRAERIRSELASSLN